MNGPAVITIAKTSSNHVIFIQTWVTHQSTARSAGQRCGVGSRPALSASSSFLLCTNARRWWTPLSSNICFPTCHNVLSLATRYLTPSNPPNSTVSLYSSLTPSIHRSQDPSIFLKTAGKYSSIPSRSFWGQAITHSITMRLFVAAVAFMATLISLAGLTNAGVVNRAEDSTTTRITTTVPLPTTTFSATTTSSATTSSSTAPPPYSRCCFGGCDVCGAWACANDLDCYHFSIVCAFQSARLFNDLASAANI